MDRRRYLALLAVGLAGCGERGRTDPDTGETATNSSDVGRFEPSRTESGSKLVAYDPYADVDWGTIEHHKSEFHNHVRGMVSEPADIADIYHERGYTVYAVADKGYAPTAWPWTEFAGLHEEYSENRDPEEMDVVAFPGCEFTLQEHVQGIFTTLNHDDLDYGSAVREALTAVFDSVPGVFYSGDVDSALDQIQAIVRRDDHNAPAENGGLAVLNHPHRYYTNPDESWHRYKPHFANVGREDGFIGLEAFNKEATANEDVELWDALLTEFAPGRMIWGFATDDPNDYIIGRDVDVRWTTLLLEEDEFDPTNQRQSRIAAADALRTGKTLCHQREQWDEKSEEPAAVPRIESIAVDAASDEITIEATNYDTLDWISSGEVVATGLTVSLTADYAPYIRAHLSHEGGAETSTQPFGIRT